MTVPASTVDKALLARAEALWRERRLRDETFGEHLDGFGEPAWDMLLALFVAQQAGSRWTAIADLVASVPVPADIARPYVGWLATQDLTETRGNLTGLTNRGRELMRQYLQGGENSG